MKPFNLEEYLANPSRKIVTREGKPARTICTDAKVEKYPLLALVTEKDGQESFATFETSGKFRGGYNSHLDLFFAPEKHEGWLNIYRSESGFYLRGNPYKSKEEAEEVAKANYKNICTTVKIEWEE